MIERPRAAIASRVALAMLGAIFVSACDSGAKPEAGPAPTSCVALMPRIRAAAIAYDANAGMFVDHLMPRILASCLDDHWPAEVRECIAHQAPDALAHDGACMNLVSADLEQRVRARLTSP